MLFLLWGYIVVGLVICIAIPIATDDVGVLVLWRFGSYISATFCNFGHQVFTRICGEVHMARTRCYYTWHIPMMSEFVCVCDIVRAYILSAIMQLLCLYAHLRIIAGIDIEHRHLVAARDMWLV